MDASLFAKAAREEKDAMLENYLSSTDSMAGEQIAKLKAAGASDELLREVFDSVLTDCFYNILLGIDGQRKLRIYKMNGCLKCEAALKFFVK